MNSTHWNTPPCGATAWVCQPLSDGWAIALPAGQVLVLEQAAGWSVCCQWGQLLLTGAAPVGERQLAPGESCVLGRGLHILDSTENVRLCVHPPAFRPCWGLSWPLWTRRMGAAQLRIRPSSPAVAVNMTLCT